MTNKPIIECIKEYLKNCPYLTLLENFDTESTSKGYSVQQIEELMIIGTNVLGNITHRECKFMIVTSVLNPSLDLENLKNLHLFESMTEWCYQNTRKRIFPSLNDNEEVESISVETGEFIFNDDNTTFKYQITCKMLYDKKEEI